MVVWLAGQEMTGGSVGTVVGPESSQPNHQDPGESSEPDPSYLRQHAHNSPHCSLHSKATRTWQPSIRRSPEEGSTSDGRNVVGDCDVDRYGPGVRREVEDDTRRVVRRHMNRRSLGRRRPARRPRTSARATASGSVEPRRPGATSTRAGVVPRVQKTPPSGKRHAVGVHEVCTGGPGDGFDGSESSLLAGADWHDRARLEGHLCDGSRERLVADGDRHPRDRHRKLESDSRRVGAVRPGSRAEDHLLGRRNEDLARPLGAGARGEPDRGLVGARRQSDGRQRIRRGSERGMREELGGVQALERLESNARRRGAS